MKILVCVDGEPHTEAAIERAIELALSESAELTALHVVDSWLRQFASEIYAQGRKEYLEHVDACLTEIANKARAAFAAQCAQEGLDAAFKVRHGEPLEEILAEVHDMAPDLVITGGKQLTAWGRFKSRNLPACLEAELRSGAAAMTETIIDPRSGAERRAAQSAYERTLGHPAQAGPAAASAARR